MSHLSPPNRKLSQTSVRKGQTPKDAAANYVNSMPLHYQLIYKFNELTFTYGKPPRTEPCLM